MVCGGEEMIDWIGSAAMWDVTMFAFLVSWMLGLLLLCQLSPME